MVHGRVRVDVWEREDKPSSVTWIVDATFVGHDLTKGTSASSRRCDPTRDPREDEAVREMVHAYEADGPQLDSAGEPVTAPAAVPVGGTDGPDGRLTRLGHVGVPPLGWRIMAEYVFTLRNVRKAHGDKVVLDNVTLSFLHGAKIGVVGPNGTGKSTLLKIMAGLEKANNGDAIIDPEATVGMLQQEPPLSEGKTVLENVEEAVGEIKGKLDRYNAISEELADPDADYDTLLAEMGDLQTDLDHASAWDLDSRLDQAMDALRCPPPDVAGRQPLRW